MNETYTTPCPACRASLKFEADLERSVYSTQESTCPACKAALQVVFHPPDLGGPACLLRERYEAQAAWLELAWEKHRQSGGTYWNEPYTTTTLPIPPRLETMAAEHAAPAPAPAAPAQPGHPKPAPPARRARSPR